MPQIFAQASPSGRGGDIRWSWVTLAGPDARDFLHRLTSVNVKPLKIGEGRPGLWLNPQGKIRAYFSLWRYGESEYAFELDAGAEDRWKKSLLAAVDQYTFAEKLQLADVSGLEWRWIFAEPEEEAGLLQSFGAPGGAEPGGGATWANEEEIRFCHHGRRDFGRAWVSAWGRPQRLAQWLERALPQARAIDRERLDAWRVSAARPWVDAELTDATIPLEAGLVDALAGAKGCYPGQEVIERITSLGAPARRLVRIEITGPAGETAAGQPILNLAEPPQEIGTLTTVARASAQALGFVRKIQAQQGLEVRLGAAGVAGRISEVAPYV